MVVRGSFIGVALCGSVVVLGASAASVAQTPQPFPRPGEQRPVAPPPAEPATAPQQPPVLPPPAREPAANEVPTEATLGVPIYPGADYIGSFDAGRGQRYYLFGTSSDFTQIVNYYKSVLKQKGELIYEEPAIHQFDIGRFREESMAFPPSVSVKDYTWGGSLGYLNPKRGAQPARFKTVIQIVPVPAIQ